LSYSGTSQAARRAPRVLRGLAWLRSAWPAIVEFWLRRLGKSLYLGPAARVRTSGRSSPRWPVRRGGRCFFATGTETLHVRYTVTGKNRIPGGGQHMQTWKLRSTVVPCSVSTSTSHARIRLPLHKKPAGAPLSRLRLRLYPQDGVKTSNCECFSFEAAKT
jgi:hypothetical protein